MNKFMKMIGGAALLTGAACLIHRKVLKNYFQDLKNSVHDFRQLSNRLGKQLNATKRNAANFTSTLRKIHPDQIKNKFNNFNRRTQPRINQIQVTNTQMKRDLHRN